MNRSTNGLFFIISAPAGCGKTTLVTMLQKEFPYIKKAVTYTTRAPRKEENDGVDYFFISKEEFEKRKRNKEFVEDSVVFDNYYGISIDSLQKAQEMGESLFLVIDTQGAEKIAKKMDVITIFILPPSMEALKKRLDDRKSDSEKEKNLRLSRAKDEIRKAFGYNYIVMNDKLPKAFDALRSIVMAEEHRVRENTKEKYEKLIK